MDGVAMEEQEIGRAEIEVAAERKIVGFSLKPVKKKAAVLFSDNKQQEKRELITGLEHNSIESSTPSSNEVLVIPLPNKDRKRREQGATEQQSASAIDTNGQVPMDVPPVQAVAESLDEMAARELMNDLNNGSATSQPNIAIDVDTTNTLVMSNKRKPILLENQPEELAGVTDETDRYQLDLALRADDMDVRSDRYQAIPVADFGAAMLRGMGWSGPTKDDEELAKSNFLPVPREARLGLGATAKPPDAKDKRKTSGKSKEKAWKSAASERLSSQQVEEDDIVWLRTHAYAGQRARVIQSRGVPGLDQILVQLEGKQEATKVGKRDAVLVPLEELKSQPFSTPKVHVKRANEAREDDDPFKMREQRRDGSRNREHPRKRQRGDRSEHDRNRYRDRDDGRHKNYSRSTDKHSSKYEDEGSATAGWLRPQVRVRVLSKKLGSRHFLKKGTVTDLPARGMAALEMDSGEVLTDVKEKYLETVLPAVEGECIVLVGDRSGETARVLEKLKDREKVTVQYTDDLQIETLAMDHVAAVAV